MIIYTLEHGHGSIQVPFYVQTTRSILTHSEAETCENLTLGTSHPKLAVGIAKKNHKARKTPM